MLFRDGFVVAPASVLSQTVWTSVESILLVHGIDRLFQSVPAIRQGSSGPHTTSDYYRLVVSQGIQVAGWCGLEYFMMPDSILFWWEYVTQCFLCLPHLLIFEIVFDFFHYWTHRTLHTYGWLYRNVHKHHHVHTAPSSIHTFRPSTPFRRLVDECDAHVCHLFSHAPPLTVPVVSDLYE